jgi:hypothetical protein
MESNTTMMVPPTPIPAMVPPDTLRRSSTFELVLLPSKFIIMVIGYGLLVVNGD